MLNTIIKQLEKRFNISFPAMNVWFHGSPFKVYEYKQLHKDMNLNKTDKLLDFGCGKGRQTILLSKYVISTVGVDISSKQIAIAKKYFKIFEKKRNINFIKADILKDNHDLLRNNYFDKVVSVCVLEHVKNVQKVVDKLFRLLKKGGEIHLSLDSLSNGFSNELIEKHKKNCYVEQYFTIPSISNILKNSGFKIIEIKSILKSDYAVNEFQKRILSGSRYNLFRKFFAYNKFKRDDEKLKNIDEGIFIIARAIKP